MCCSSQSFPSVKLAKTWLIIGLFTSLISFGQLAAAGPAPAEPASSATVPANPESLGITIFWAGAALFACVAAAGGIILARKLHQQKALVAAGAVAAPAPASQKLFSLPSTGNGSKSNGSKPFRFNNRPAKTSKPLNNHANGNNTKRRRMFNYHKFYTEMVLQGPSPSSVAENAYNPYNGYNGYYVEYESPRINNNGNGHNGNGHHAPASSESNGAHVDLLATQKSLIQDQQRLIHEQARLIEEKSRLIAEKNQLLERQSQMLDNNLL
jgi:hypothetical protein